MSMLSHCSVLGSIEGGFSKTWLGRTLKSKRCAWPNISCFTSKEGKSRLEVKFKLSASSKLTPGPLGKSGETIFKSAAAIFSEFEGGPAGPI